MPKQRELSMPIPRWQKPATKYYDNNYSFGMNFYQPMIDWIDDRDRGLPMRSRELPHLPWLNERGLKKYNPSALGIKTYSKDRARELAVEAQLRAKESLSKTEEGSILHHRSPFSLAKQVEVATSLTKKVLNEKFEERHADKFLRERELADLRRRTEDLLLEHRPHLTMDDGLTSSTNYRARSRRAIANELIMESMRHLQDSRTDEEIRRAYSENRRNVRTYQTPYWFFKDGSVGINPYLNRSPRVVAGDIMTDSLNVLKRCETPAQVRHALRTARKDMNHYFHVFEEEAEEADQTEKMMRKKKPLRPLGLSYDR